MYTNTTPPALPNTGLSVTGHIRHMASLLEKNGNGACEWGGGEGVEEHARRATLASLAELSSRAPLTLAASSAREACSVAARLPARSHSVHPVSPTERMVRACTCAAAPLALLRTRRTSGGARCPRNTTVGSSKRDAPAERRGPALRSASPRSRQAEGDVLDRHLGRASGVHREGSRAPARGSSTCTRAKTRGTH